MPRKPKRQAAARSPRRRRNKHGGCLIFVILFVIIGLGMFLAAHKKNNPDLTWPDVVEEALPETVRETVKEVLPQTVKEEIEKVRKKERKEIEKEKIEKIEKEEKQGPIRDHPVEEKKTVPPAAKKESAKADENSLGLAPGAYKGRLAIVIDDCGYQLGPVRTLTSLPLKMTFAVIPFKPNSAAALSIIRNSGHTAMLHLPMEPVSGGSSETRFVGVGQTKAQIASFVQEAIDSLPGISGVNNHQGSKATAHGPTIRAALSVIGENGLFFIDSRTNSATVAEREADITRSFSITAVISVPLRKRLRRLSSWQTVMAVSLSSVMLGPIRQKPGNGLTRLLYNRALLWSLPRPCYSKEVI